MIFDKIENTSRYAPIAKRIALGLEYIRKTDFSIMGTGRHEIQGEDLFVVLTEYETKDVKECSLEAHCKYIDIQYMLSGEELIGVTLLKGQVPSKAYNADDDYALYSDACSFHEMKPGMFAIFFPEDLHMPGVSLLESSKVRKVIVKVRV